MKRFVVKVIMAVLPLLLLFLYPSVRYIQGAFYGDISGMGYYSFSPEYRWIHTYDPGFERHVTITEDYPSCASDSSSVLIVGDSFTQQGRRTFLEFLQNEMHDWNVYNVQTATDFENWQYLHKSLMTHEGDTSKTLVFQNMGEYIVYMLQHSPVLPNTIVMESTECFFVGRMLAMRDVIDDDSLQAYSSSLGIHRAVLPNDAPFSPWTGNLYADMKKISDSSVKWVKKFVGIGNRARKMVLSKPMFTCEGDEDNLYFGDISKYTFSHGEMLLAVKAAKKLIAMAEERGVKIIFFIVPDKMQLYRDFAENVKPEYSNPCLSDSLAYLSDNIHFQLNKPLLRDAIKAGEKDLYLCNDIHRSYKASQITARHLAKRIRTYNLPPKQ